jgi:hypothetical protein
VTDTTLTPLATTADLTARGITSTADEASTVDTFLREASSAVREAAGCAISQATSTVTLLGERDTELRLPAPPVQTVSSVSIDGLAVTDYRLAGDTLYRACGWRTECLGPSVVTVTYQHGLPVVPEDIVGMVCVLVAGALRASRESDDGTSLAPDPTVGGFSIDDYSETGPNTGQPAPFTRFEIPEDVRARLRSRFGGGSYVVTPR